MGTRIPTHRTPDADFRIVFLATICQTAKTDYRRYCYYFSPQGVPGCPLEFAESSPDTNGQLVTPAVTAGTCTSMLRSYMPLLGAVVQCLPRSGVDTSGTISGKRIQPVCFMDKIWKV